MKRILSFILCLSLMLAFPLGAASLDVSCAGNYSASMTLTVYVESDYLVSIPAEGKTDAEIKKAARADSIQWSICDGETTTYVFEVK